jgi:SAM-dependent methyltransferase
LERQFRGGGFAQPSLMKKARSTVLSPVRRLVRSSLILSPSISGKLISLSDRHSNFVQPKREAEDVPPRELWENYAFTEEAYLESGQRDVAAVLDAVEPFLAEWPRVALDFGCAAARMLRFFPAEKDSELWGVDINAEHVSWCQRHLPRLNFATTSTAPHLPFEDAYFDLVYAASVFTHISDLADAWLLELRRVMRKGAIAYVTVHDTITYRQLFTKYALDPLFSRWLKRPAALSSPIRHWSAITTCSGSAPTPIRRSSTTGRSWKRNGENGCDSLRTSRKSTATSLPSFFRSPELPAAASHDGALAEPSADCITSIEAVEKFGPALVDEVGGGIANVAIVEALSSRARGKRSEANVGAVAPSRPLL